MNDRLTISSVKSPNVPDNIPAVMSCVFLSANDYEEQMT